MLEKKRMNPEVKRLWIDALLGGDYRQGEGLLRTHDNTYCCLGVLCDLAVKQGGVVTRGWHKTDLGAWRIDITEAGSVLPDSVAEWAGIYYHPEVEINDQRETLAGLNDSGKSFLEIAAIIQEHF